MEQSKPTVTLRVRSGFRKSGVPFSVGVVPRRVDSIRGHQERNHNFGKSRSRNLSATGCRSQADCNGISSSCDPDVPCPSKGCVCPPTWCLGQTPTIVIKIVIIIIIIIAIITANEPTASIWDTSSEQDETTSGERTLCPELESHLEILPAASAVEYP